MKDGSLLSMPVPEGLNGYLYWMKENTTNCKFRLIYSDKSEYNTDITSKYEIFSLADLKPEIEKIIQNG